MLYEIFSVLAVLVLADQINRHPAILFLTRENKKKSLARECFFWNYLQSDEENRLSLSKSVPPPVVVAPPRVDVMHVQRRIVQTLAFSEVPLWFLALSYDVL